MTVEQQIIEKIKEFDTIIIHRHQRPDPDAFGSQCGLATILRASFPQKQIYQVGKDEPSLAWIGQEQEIADSVYADALVIVTDTANRPRVDDDRYLTGKFLIKIDHHPNDDPYGDLMLVRPEASSCSELIVDLVNAAAGTLVLNREAATKLYAGIVGDTGRFMYAGTTAHTMEVTAQLMHTGIAAAAINRKLDEISKPEARLAAYVLQNMQFTAHDAAYIVLTKDVLAELDLGDAGTSSAVPLLGKIAQTICWTVFVEQRDGSYRLRIRSKRPHINELAKEYGGGGHPLASGAMISDATQIPEFVAKLDQIAAKDTGDTE